MAAAVGSIISGVLGSANQAGQKENMNTNTGAQGGVANFGNQKPDIKQADVKQAATDTNTPQEAPKAQSSGNEQKWAQMANMAQGLLSSNSGGQSQNMTFNGTSTSQPIANFR